MAGESSTHFREAAYVAIGASQTAFASRRCLFITVSRMSMISRRFLAPSLLDLIHIRKWTSNEVTDNPYCGRRVGGFTRDDFCGPQGFQGDASRTPAGYAPRRRSCGPLHQSCRDDAWIESAGGG